MSGSPPPGMVGRTGLGEERHVRWPFQRQSRSLQGHGYGPPHPDRGFRCYLASSDAQGGRHPPLSSGRVPLPSQLQGANCGTTTARSSRPSTLTPHGRDTEQPDRQDPVDGVLPVAHGAGAPGGRTAEHSVLGRNWAARQRMMPPASSERSDRVVELGSSGHYWPV
jgi:hypothetical protein